MTVYRDIIGQTTQTPQCPRTPDEPSPQDPVGSDYFVSRGLPWKLLSAAFHSRSHKFFYCREISRLASPIANMAMPAEDHSNCIIYQWQIAPPLSPAPVISQAIPIQSGAISTTMPNQSNGIYIWCASAEKQGTGPLPLPM